MAGVLPPTAPGGPSPILDRRIVLLGKAGARKTRVVRVVLGDTKLNEESKECFLYQGETAGKKNCIVDTPGWDGISIECTTREIKEEITRSVTLCPPGPHALILVLPIKTGDVPSVNELKSVSQHMELLSERVWNYTMLLFLCDGDVEESTIKDHIQNAEKLLEKCRGRHYVMRMRDFDTEVHGLLKKIDSMAEELGDFFQPQVSYDTIQTKKPHEEDPQKNTDKSHGEDDSEGKNVLRQRRGSFQGRRPDMTKQTEDSESHKVATEATKRKNPDQLSRWYMKPVVVILMGVIGALIGSVTGALYGTMGAAVGIVIGFVVSMLLSLLLVKLIT